MAKRKISLIKKFIYILEFIVVVPLSSLLSLLPLSFLRAIAKPLSLLIFYLDRKNKKIAEYNFRIVYKDNPLSKEEKERLIKKLYHNLVLYGVEYLKLGAINKKNYKKFVEFEGYEYVDEALQDGKGLIVVTGHIGNWEYLGSIPAKLGKNLAVIINRQFNPYTDWWLKHIREKQGKIKCFYNEVSDLSKIVRHLKNGGIVGTLVDQTYYFQPIFVPFFGMPSATADGPAKLHLKYKAPLMMAFGIRKPDGKYLLKFYPHVYFEKTENFEEDCKRIMTWINSEYEKIILKFPEQWFSFFHHRWERTKPEHFSDIEDTPF
ncbi:MAG: lysophospholipid acyltransferase family protein [Brevinematia bacterium]